MTARKKADPLSSANPQGRWIVGDETDTRTGALHVVARYDKRADADLHVADINHFDSWRNVAVYDVHELTAKFFVGSVCTCGRYYTESEHRPDCARFKGAPSGDA